MNPCLCCLCCLCCVWNRLTAADLGSDSLGQSSALGQLFPEALAHIVVDVIGPQKLLKGLGGVSQVLGEDVTYASTLLQPLSEMRQLSGLSLDQSVKFTTERGRAKKRKLINRLSLVSCNVTCFWRIAFVCCLIWHHHMANGTSCSFRHVH